MTANQLLSEIGVMIGVYIMVNLSMLLSRKGEGYYKGGFIFSKVLAVIALLLTAICWYDML